MPWSTTNALVYHEGVNIAGMAPNIPEKNNPVSWGLSPFIWKIH